MIKNLLCPHSANSRPLLAIPETPATDSTPIVPAVISKPLVHHDCGILNAKAASRTLDDLLRADFWKVVLIRSERPSGKEDDVFLQEAMDEWARLGRPIGPLVRFLMLDPGLLGPSESVIRPAHPVTPSVERIVVHCTRLDRWHAPIIAMPPAVLRPTSFRSLTTLYLHSLIGSPASEVHALQPLSLIHGLPELTRLWIHVMHGQASIVISQPLRGVGHHPNPLFKLKYASLLLRPPTLDAYEWFLLNSAATLKGLELGHCPPGGSTETLLRKYGSNLTSLVLAPVGSVTQEDVVGFNISTHCTRLRQFSIVGQGPSPRLFNALPPTLEDVTFGTGKVLELYKTNDIQQWVQDPARSEQLRVLTVCGNAIFGGRSGMLRGVIENGAPGQTFPFNLQNQANFIRALKQACQDRGVRLNFRDDEWTSNHFVSTLALQLRHLMTSLLREHSLDGMRTPSWSSNALWTSAPLDACYPSASLPKRPSPPSSTADLRITCTFFPGIAIHLWSPAIH